MADTLSACSWFLVLVGNSLRLQQIHHDVPTGEAPERGNIRGFSKQSKRRLLTYLNSIDYTRTGPSLFVTLTHPDDVDVRKHRLRRNHRNLFVKTLERALGKKLGIIWRQEWIARKSGIHLGKMMPHYHLLVFGVKYIASELINSCWRNALKMGDGPLAIDIREVTGEQGVIKYIAKYLAKNPSLDIGSYLDKTVTLGRFWGVLRKELIPLCTPQELELSTRRAYDLARELGEQMLGVNSNWLTTGYRIFGPSGERIFASVKTALDAETGV